MLSLNLLEGVLSELLYGDELVLMSEAIKGLRNRFLQWKEAFESKGLKDNLGKTKVGVWEKVESSGQPHFLRYYWTSNIGLSLSFCFGNVGLFFLLE